MRLLGPPNIDRLGRRGDAAGLERALRHKDPEIRRKAIDALGSLGDARAIEPLLRLIRDQKTGPLVETALRALRTFRSPDAIEPLVGFLESTDEPRLQEALLEALAELGHLAPQSIIPFLVAGLKDPRPEHRRKAASALAALKIEPAVLPLISALEHSDPLVREEAARGLGTLFDLRAVEPLIAALDDDKPNVRSAAIWALGELRDRRAVEALTGVLDAEGGAMRKPIVRALQRIGGPDAKAVAKQVIQHDALTTLEPTLRRLFRRRSVSVADVNKLEAVCADEDFGDAFQLLEGSHLVVHDPELYERVDGALKSVADHGTKGVVGALVARLYRGISIADQWVELSHWGDEAWNEYLRKAHIARVLGKARAEAAVDALAVLVRSLSGDGLFNDTVRVASAEALLEMGSKEASGALTEAIDDLVLRLADRRDWTERQTTDEERNLIAGQLAILVEGVGAPVEKMLTHWFKRRKDPGIRSYVALVLGDAKASTAVSVLAEGIGDSHEWVRRNCASALGKIGDPRVVEPLVAALKHPDWAVRVNAATALGAIGDKRATSALCQALADSHERVRKNAAWGLAEIGDEAAVASLTSALEDEDPEVAAAAAGALERIGGTTPGG